MTPMQFERWVSNLQQRTVNEAYEEALDLASRNQLIRSHGVSLNTAIGNYIDGAVRSRLREEFSNMGIDENQQSRIAAVNRHLITPDSDKYGIPDLRLGNNLYLDSTLAFKSPNTLQIRRWHSIREGHYMIIRPDALGGSYAIPARNINKVPLPPKGFMP